MQSEFELADRTHITFHHMKPTGAIYDYILEKLDRHIIHKDLVTDVRILLKQTVAHKGTKQDFELDINVSVPKAVVRVEEKGEDVYAMIDRATETLQRRCKKYYEKHYSVV